MSKLQRKSAKLFAENATAAAGGIAQFGSLAAGTPNYSTDPDVIQSLSQYSDGWSAAVLGTKSPALEDRNALDYLLSYQQAYIMQHGVPEWLDTETYYENSYVVDSNGELRVSTIDNNTGHDPTEDNGGAYWGYAGARGSGKQIGEVYFSQSSSATDNKGALPLFTGEVIASANTIYPQFYSWVLAHPALCKTEEEWQTAISTYGECPFYVINDTDKTLRLPKLGNYIKMANITDGITQSDAGLPNITGNPTFGDDGSQEVVLHSWNPTGCFKQTEETSTHTMNSDGYGAAGKSAVFDASGSNAIYGNSNTVTPAHTTVFPWVFAFNAAIPASTAQAAEFQQALSEKVDKEDFAEVQCVVETYSNGTSWYRIYSDGWCEQGGRTVYGTSETVTVNLLKEMRDTNYSCQVTLFGDTGGYTSGVNGQYLTCWDLTTTSFKHQRFNASTVQQMWKVCGYIA